MVAWKFLALKSDGTEKFTCRSHCLNCCVECEVMLDAALVFVRLCSRVESSSANSRTRRILCCCTKFYVVRSLVIRSKVSPQFCCFQQAFNLFSEQIRCASSKSLSSHLDGEQQLTGTGLVYSRTEADGPTNFISMQSPPAHFMPGRCSSTLARRRLCATIGLIKFARLHDWNS